MNIKLTNKFLTVNGKRVGTRIDKGPWIAGVNPDQIKLRPKKGSFPREFWEVLAIENNSDLLTDYFEADQIKLLPGHSLYEAARAA